MTVAHKPGARTGRKRVYRSSETMLLCTAIGLALATYAGYEVAGYLTEGPYAGILATVPLFLLAWFIVFRWARAGVFVVQDGVRILNPFKTTAVAWQDIRCFRVGAHGIWSNVGIVELSDGREIVLLGICVPNPLTRPTNKTAEALVSDLEEVRHQVQVVLD
jgi:hypothetical protein